MEDVPTFTSGEIARIITWATAAQYKAVTGETMTMGASVIEAVIIHIH